MNGVYRPSRLVIHVVCQRAVGTVKLVRPKEADGDLHIGVRLTKDYSALLSAGNSKQEGLLVVEFMPRDAGHLPKPKVGDKLTLVGAWVTDTQHDWNELHPVWRVILAGTTYTSGPQYGGSRKTDTSKTAAAHCRDQHDHVCAGY